MKNRLLNALTAVILLLMPTINFGQVAPNLGATSGFALFTAGGGFSTNSEAGTVVTGDVGNHTGANSAFPPGTLNGATHWLDPLATTAATDVLTAYSDLNQGGSVISVTLDGQTLTPGVYFTGTGAAATLSTTLTLDGGGNPNAMFIIRVDGALTIAASATVSLINSASLCNVYWQVNGAFGLGAGSVFRGTLINNGAISLLEGSSLYGRGLSTAGDINLYTNVVTIPSSSAAAGTVVGTATVCQGQTGVAYSVPTITNATSYIWSLPAGATITAGANTNSITVSFSASASSGTVTVQGSNSCGAGAVSADFVVTIGSSVAAAGTITGTAAVCQGQTGVAYSVPTITNATSYIWTLPTGATITAGANTNSITVSFSNTATSGSITVQGSCSCGTGSVSANFAVTVGSSVAAAGTITGTAAVCQGQTGVAYSVPTITNATSYIWTLPAGATITAGANTNSITVSFSNTAASGSITVQGSCSCGTGSVSANFVVTVNSLPTAATGSNAAICSGYSVTLGASSTSGHTYSWMPATGLSSATIANPVATLTATTTYTLTEIITATGCQKTNSVAVTVNTAPSITTVSSNQTVCTGSSASFSVTATGAGLTYQWRKGTVNLTNAGNISGATSAVLTINPATITDAAANYNVVITGTCSPSATSANVTLTINTAAAITSAPSNQAVCTGSSASFSVTATGAGLTYQWRKGTVNLTNGGNISGATSAMLTVNPATITDVAANYNVVIAGTCSSNTTSANASLAINTAPSITTVSSNQTVCAGSSVSFSVTATGTSLTYQWRKGTVNLTNGGNIAGATSAVLTINPATITDAAANYNVVIAGTCSPNATSANVTLAINTAPSITTVPSNQTVCTGSSASFSVTATGTGLTYQWRKGTVNLVNGGNISGATSAVLTINPATITDAVANYNVVIAGTCSPNAASANVSLTISTPPHITLEPRSQMALDGGSKSFVVAATGAGLTYQWRKGSVNLINGGNISGATSATLTINPASIADTADYDVIVSGMCVPNETSTSVPLFVCVCSSGGIITIGSGNTNEMVTLYPNPFKASLNMKINNASQIDKAEVEIYDVLGAAVISTTITKQITTIETSYLPAGVYIYKVISNHKVIQSGKLISQ